VAQHLDGVSLTASAAIAGFAVVPAVFGLVWLALPAWRARGLAALFVAFAACAVVFDAAGFSVLASFAKLGAMTFLAWAFLGYFETLAWVVLVAVIIPWVDAYSVFFGPTKAITEHHASVFDKFSVGFAVPGGGLFQLGLPDVLFFALFLAAAARFALRPFATWLALVVGLGLTLLIVVTTDVTGLPALPAIALGFLVPNADLIWRRLRGRDVGLGDRPPHVSVDAPAHH
jgi:hypothetical protein